MPGAELKGKVAWITGGGSGIGLAGHFARCIVFRRYVSDGFPLRFGIDPIKCLKSCIGEC